jgi:hypothetical protein
MLENMVPLEEKLESYNNNNSSVEGIYYYYSELFEAVAEEYR